MKYIKRLTLGLVLAVSTGCSTTGGPVVITDTDLDHKVNVGRALTDAEPLSVQVRELLKNNGQTALAGILVSQPSADTIRLAGTVSNSAVVHEAERLAYQPQGVRFVVNTLQVQR